MPRKVNDGPAGPTSAAALDEPDAPEAPGISSYFTWFRRQPGGLQMLIGFALILLATPLAAFVPLVVKGTKGERDHSESLVSLVGSRAIIVLLIPILLAAIPLTMARHRRRRMARNLSVFLLGLWMLTSGLSIFYFFGTAVMVWGAMQASRTEGPSIERPSWLRRRVPSGEGDESVDLADIQPDRLGD